MRVIYHIDTHAWDIAPLVHAAMDFHKAKGISDVKIAVSPVDIYERYKAPDYLEFQKQAKPPRLEEFPLSSVFEVEASTEAKSILKEIKKDMLWHIKNPDTLQSHKTTTEKKMAEIRQAYDAFYNDAKKEAIPLPEPSLVYKENTDNQAEKNNNFLIMRAFSSKVSKSREIGKSKKNLAEKEKIAFIKEAMANQTAEPEAHIVITQDDKFKRDLREIATGQNRFFIVTPEEFTQSMHRAAVVEQYAKVHKDLQEALPHIRWALKDKAAVKYSRNEETDIRDVSFSQDSLAAFFSNPPIAAQPIVKR